MELFRHMCSQAVQMHPKGVSGSCCQTKFKKIDHEIKNAIMLTYS